MGASESGASRCDEGWYELNMHVVGSSSHILGQVSGFKQLQQSLLPEVSARSVDQASGVCKRMAVILCFSLDNGDTNILCSAFLTSCRVIYGAHARSPVTPPYDMKVGKAEAYLCSFIAPHSSMGSA